MKKLLSAMWKLPFPALLAIYAVVNGFATFKYTQLVSGGTMTQLLSEFASLGVEFSATYYAFVLIFEVVFSTLLNYVMIRVWYWFFSMIYARSFNRGRETFVRIRLPFNPSQFASLIFILLIFFNLLKGLVRLAYFAGAQYFYLVEQVLVPACAFIVIAFGAYVFNRYIFTENVAYNATLALSIPLVVAVLFYL